ncbi:MAG: flagellar hook-associated protein FlgK [Magnetococcales bacterium]|nr:flagellar hook-associated protein FlgK [Magnetococcales bacterium]
MSISDLLNVSKLGIFANQGAMQAVSHNIANVNTPGYSRQTVSLQSEPGWGEWRIGSGVQVQEAKRQLDNLLDRRLAMGNGEMGRLQARERFLTIVENVFNEMDGDGFSERLDSLYSAADLLTDNPTNPVGRADLVSRAEGLAGFVNKMQESLRDRAMPVDKEIDVVMADINGRLQNIRKLNGQIGRTEATRPALDLKDHLRNEITALGEMVDIQTLDMQDGSVQVMTAKGQELLADTVYAATFTRSAQQTASGYPGISLNGRDFTSMIGGQIRGLMEVRDEVIHGPDGLLTRFKTITDELRWQLNRVSSQSVSQALFSGQTGAFSLGGDLTTAMNALVTDATSDDYVGSPPDLGRVTAGSVTFAYGADGDHLTTDTVAIDPGASIEAIRAALDASPAIKAEIVGNRLKLSAQSGVYGVVSDTSGVLAALGVGALFSSVGARSFEVSDELVEDPDKLGVGRLEVDADGTVTFNDADNRGAIALGELRTSKYELFDDNLTLTAHYASMVGILGSTIQRNDEALKAQGSTQDFLKNLRDSYSGVSLEEELTDLIRYQRAFQASSKMVTAADELLKSIVSMV